MKFKSVFIGVVVVFAFVPSAHSQRVQASCSAATDGCRSFIGRTPGLTLQQCEAAGQKCRSSCKGGKNGVFVGPYGGAQYPVATCN
jgi:hypothetical protein